MKKNIYGILLMAFVMTLAMVSCQKDTVTIRARLTGLTTNNGKTYLGGENDRLPIWKSGDEIWINGSSYAIGRADGRTTTISNVERTGTYRAIYPASIVTGQNDANSANIAITLPSEQYYSTFNGKQVVEAPMGASCVGSNNPTLDFTNMGAVLAIEMTNNTAVARSENLTIDNITVTSLNPNVALWGAGRVENINSADRKYVITESLTGQADDPHLSVSLKDINTTLSNSATNPTIFYIYVPASAGVYLNHYQITVEAHSSAGTFIYTKAQPSNPAGEGDVYLNHIGYLPLNLAEAEEQFVAIQIPDGAINALFTVGEGVQVYFSKGNLRYLTTEQRFEFAHSQYDKLGVSDADGDGVMELFGWGANGYNDPNDPNQVNYDPTSNVNSFRGTSSTDPVRRDNSYGYGPSLSNQDGIDLASNYNFDWGSQITATDATWRTLTEEEWGYLLTGRACYAGNNEGSYRKVIVNEIKGLMIFPDDFHHQNEICGTTTGSGNNIYYTCAVTIQELEDYNVVFLPETGSRMSANNWSNKTYYWSADCSNSAQNARAIPLANLRATGIPRYYGCAVRLVTNVQ